MMLKLGCLWALIGNWPTHDEIRTKAQQEGMPLVVFVGIVPEAGYYIYDYEPGGLVPHIRVSRNWGSLEYAGFTYCPSGIHQLIAWKGSP